MCTRDENFAEQLEDPVAGRVKSKGESPLDPRLAEEMRVERQIVKEMSYNVVGIQQQYLVLYPRFLIATILLQTVGRQLPLGQ